MMTHPVQDAIISHGSFLKECTVEHAIVGVRSRIESGCDIKVGPVRLGPVCLAVTLAVGTAKLPLHSTPGLSTWSFLARTQMVAGSFPFILAVLQDSRCGGAFAHMQTAGKACCYWCLACCPQDTLIRASSFVRIGTLQTPATALQDAMFMKAASCQNLPL